jgi:hypothetical protein
VIERIRSEREYLLQQIRDREEAIARSREVLARIDKLLAELGHGDTSNEAP